MRRDSSASSRIRIGEATGGRFILWLRGIAISLSQEEAEELFDKLGMVIEGLNEADLDALLTTEEGGS